MKTANLAVENRATPREHIAILAATVLHQASIPLLSSIFTTIIAIGYGFVAIQSGYGTRFAKTLFHALMCYIEVNAGRARRSTIRPLSVYAEGAG